MPRKPKTTNWSQYNKVLKDRGGLSIWICQEYLESVQKKTQQNIPHKRGHPVVYPDQLIELMLSVRYLFRLPLRQTIGFSELLFPRLGLHFPLPHFSTLSRRGKDLSVTLAVKKRNGQPIDIAVDSTGIKVYGEGEWKTRQHGVSKRRTWRKVHYGVSLCDFEICSVVVTTNNVHDSEAGCDLLGSIEGPLSKVYGDGAYDTQAFRKKIHEKGGIPIIPPREDGVIHPAKADLEERNKALEHIQNRQNEGDSLKKARKDWKVYSGYHQRSKAETHMFRFKVTFGDKCQSRDFDNQATEIFIKSNLLNRFTRIGMPNIKKVA